MKFPPYFTTLKINWMSIFQKEKFKPIFFVTIIILLSSLISLSGFLEFNENREGIMFTDPFLSMFEPINLTWLSFVLIYFALIVAVVNLLEHPAELILTLQAYTLMILVRILMMYSLPLNPPELLIPLTDPFVEFFGSGIVLEKDLFFSGHTSTMFLLFLTSKSSKLKTIFLAATILVGLSVLLQHVHYTIDVLVAPFVAYGCYRLVIYFNEKFIPKGFFKE